MPKLFSIVVPGEAPVHKGKQSGERAAIASKGGVKCLVCDDCTPACSAWGNLQNCQAHWNGKSLDEHMGLLWAMRLGAAMYSQLDAGKPVC